MFEDYLFDAHYFYNKAISCDNEDMQKRYFRASVFCIASAVESFINHIGNSFESAGSTGLLNLNDHEIAFLNDKVLEFNSSKGEVISKIKYYSIEDKIKFVIKKFCIDIDLGSNPNWNYFKNTKELRDSLIHSRSLEDEIEVSAYNEKIRTGLNSVIFILDQISLKVFGKPLRTKLKELAID